MTTDEVARGAGTGSLVLLEAAVDTVQEAIAVCRSLRDGAGTYVGAEIRYANRFARDRWVHPGAPLDAIVGRDLYELVPHTRDLFELHRSVVETGDPHTGVARVAHGSGARWLDLHIARFEDGFVVTSRDVTAQEEVARSARAAEERLRRELTESEERFRLALDAVIDTLAVLRAVRDDAGAIVDFEIVYANRSWRDVHAGAEDPVGRRLYASYPEFLERRERHVRTTETGEAVGGITVLERPVGRRWFEYQLTRFGDGYVSSGRDVTDRVVAETALKANEERLKDLVSGVDAIISLEDELTGEAWVSPQAERILGFPAERLADVRFWMSRVHPDDSSWVIPIWDHETDEYELEYRILAADERIVWLRERITHQIDPARGLDRWLGIAVDITERKALEDQLVRSQRMESLGRLASGVAHDFNNVLYGISILAGYLVRELPDGPSREEAHRIGEAVDRGSALTRQLLAFARGGSGSGIRERTDVPAVVTSVAGMLDILLGSAVAVEVETRTTASCAVVDRTGLEQALVNLATNARDAMPDGGTIRLVVDEVDLGDESVASLDVDPGRYVRITVADTGKGVAPEVADRIFEPFATTKPVETGTGLGLSNVYAFVRAERGAIGFESREGVGTTFTIHLPLAD